MSMTASIKAWARRIKRDAVMLWFARSHRDTPLFLKALCIVTVAYALSPIDLIPDFVPVLGYIDDAILLPAMIWLAVRLLPTNVVCDCRIQAEEWIGKQKTKLKSYMGAVAIIILWGVVAYLGWRWLNQ